MDLWCLVSSRLLTEVTIVYERAWVRVGTCEFVMRLLARVTEESG